MVRWEASPLGDGFAWGRVAEGLASHRRGGGLDRVLWEASPLGDGPAMQQISEGRQQTGQPFRLRLGRGAA